MPVYTVKELRENLAEDNQDDPIIAVIWQRSDFPRVWDRIIEAYTEDWNQQLVDATGDRLEALCSLHLDINLRQEAEDKLDEEIERCEAVAQQHGLASTWSIDGTEFDRPHTFPTARILRDQGLDDPAAIDEAIKGRTWLDLWRAADRIIARQKNPNHRFIEGFEIDGADPTLLHLQTGS